MQNVHSQTLINARLLALRFFIACVGWTVLLLCAGNVLLRLLTPLFAWEIGALAPYFKIVQFAVNHSLGSHVFLLKVSIAEMMVVGGQFISPNPIGIATATSVVSYIWQVSVLYCALLCTWPLKTKTEGWVRVWIALPLLLLTLLLDTPLALLGAIWDIIYQAYPAEKISILIDWNHFMMGGGRLMLGLVAAMLTIFLANLLNQRCHKGNLSKG